MTKQPSPKHAALALALACQACATTALPRPVDTDVGRSVRAVPSARARVRVQQSGSTVTVSATRICDLRAVRTVDRAEARRIFEDHPSSSAFPMLMVGNVIGVGGVITFHASLATSEEHLGRDLATGVVLSAVGAALIGAGVALSRKTTRIEMKQARREVDEGLVREDAPCDEVSPAAHLPVTAKVLGPPHLEIPFGDTDAEGALVIDLSEALPRSLLRAPSAGATLTLYLGEIEAGTVRLDEVARAMKQQIAGEEDRRP